ncbi:acyltransferase family protein [Methanoregula formicica]|uniref:Putative acyltransferase n=1 Tax=Methanoregula formicica (strain DSM 22288 / NBRC 105244 / SMSP) TaxID=593750 RepID=L0HA33_METFS|nr:acyltransferase [Methanoregula formicica]AGB01607.1 putative acyltransferase [Methanoregula formicica SMSP]
MAMSTGRSSVADLVRAFAILLVISVHMQNFLSVPLRADPFAFEVLKFIAIACFTAVSGYVIHAANRKIRSIPEAVHFYKKRNVRVYPLYLVALVLFFLGFQVAGFFPPLHLTPADWIVNVLCLQVILSPAFAEPVFTLWFIGFIMAMYAIYPLLSGIAGVWQKVAAAAGIILGAVLFHYTLGIIDFRFFLYYFFFIGGMIAAECGNRFTCGARYSQIVPGSRLARAGGAVAYSSYCVFLFHMPVFTIAGSLLSASSISGNLGDAIIVLLVIPAIFFSCYHVQRSYDRLTGDLQARLRNEETATPAGLL